MLWGSHCSLDYQRYRNSTRDSADESYSDPDWTSVSIQRIDRSPFGNAEALLHNGNEGSGCWRAIQQKG